MKTIAFQNEPAFWEQLKRPQLESSNLENVIRSVFEAVEKDRDQALLKLTAKFDEVELDDITVSEKEIKEAKEALSENLKDAIGIAASNIRKFHSVQLEHVQKTETTPGVVCWRKSVGIEKVGLYIPGGTAPLFSTVLMLGIPAKIVDCEEIILCTPPNKEGKIHPAILFAASVAGINKIYKVGGAQAIAALHYGTESIEKVYKIFGPGNQYVTAAKQYAAALGTAIDMPAGPSEVMVVAGPNAIAEFVAADLLSQAEHGADSQVILVSSLKDFIPKVIQEIKVQMNSLSRKSIIEKSLQHALFIETENNQEIVSIINKYAPEHLILGGTDYEWVAENVKNAGSVFLGNYTPESAGDYASGTNHTLPTYGFAKQYSGVSTDSFLKKITFQEISKEGLENLSVAIELMAEAEMLDAHKNAVTIRKNFIEE